MSGQATCDEVFSSAVQLGLVGGLTNPRLQSLGLTRP